MNEEQAAKLEALHRALMEPPVNKPKERPLVEKMSNMSTVYENSRIAGRVMMWLIITAGALAAALSSIAPWFRRMFEP
jgi:Na+(H+)/acetate symporter ActP